MSEPTTPERADLLEILRVRRGFLKRTVQRLTDQQAALTPTVSELCLGGLVKHVTETEAEWCRFILEGPAGSGLEWSADAVETYANQFRMLAGETLTGVLAAYDETAAQTDALVLSEDLDRRQPLPSAPWFPAGATRSVRQVFLHIAAETAQHAGHADIIRESIDGQKSMG